MIGGSIWFSYVGGFKGMWSEPEEGEWLLSPVSDAGAMNWEN